MYQVSRVDRLDRHPSRMDPWQDVTVVWIAATVLGLLDIVWPASPGWMRAVLGIPFGVAAPGYLVTLALFPGRDDLSRTERTALSLIFSIGATGGVVYGLSRAGIAVTTTTDVTALLALMGVLTVAGGIRRAHLAAANRYQPAVLPPRPMAFILGLAAILAAVTALIVTPAWQQTSPAAWITSSAGTLADPYTASAQKPATLVLHIANDEAEVLYYHLTAQINGRRYLTRTLRCPAGQRSSWPIRLPAPTGTEATLRLSLTVPGQASDARTLILHYETTPSR